MSLEIKPRELRTEMQKKLTKKIDTNDFFNLNPQLAVEFAKAANRYKADVRLERDTHQVNGKSMMGLMELASRQGNILLLSEGLDADQALAELSLLLEDGSKK